MNRAIAGDQLGEPFDKVLLLRGERGVLEFVTLAIVRSEQLDGTATFQVGPDVRRERLQRRLRERIRGDIVQ